MTQELTFGAYRFEPVTARLWCGPEEIKLTRKAGAVLAVLIARAGEPVSKQDLFGTVWRGSVVSDDALVSCIQELRKVLGDDPKKPQYIETRHGLGYRFVALAPAAGPVEPVSPVNAIAVLPFADLSAARDQDHLCEGLAEELIDALTQVTGLRVAARRCSDQRRLSGGEGWSERRSDPPARESIQQGMGQAGLDRTGS